jgi:hypothetical protein
MAEAAVPNRVLGFIDSSLELTAATSWLLRLIYRFRRAIELRRTAGGNSG